MLDFWLFEIRTDIFCFDGIGCYFADSISYLF